MITIYDKLLSSFFNLTDSFILTIVLIVLVNSLITKIIELYFKGKTKFIRDFNDYIQSKEFELTQIKEIAAEQSINDDIKLFEETNINIPKVANIVKIGISNFDNLISR